MGLRAVFRMRRYPEDDEPNSWIRLREKEEKRIDRNPIPPSVKHIPETWLPLVAGILMWHHVMLRYLVLS